MSEDIVKESIKCLANMEIKETTYQVARSVVLEEIERLKSIIKEVREHIEKTIEYEKGCGFNRWTYEDGQETYIDMVEKTLDILDKGDKENI